MAWKLDQIVKTVVHGLPIEVTLPTYIRISRIDFLEPGAMGVTWSTYPNREAWELAHSEAGSFRVIFRKDRQPEIEPILDPENQKILENGKPSVPSLSELFIEFPDLKDAIDAVKKLCYEVSTSVVSELKNATVD